MLLPHVYCSFLTFTTLSLRDMGRLAETSLNEILPLPFRVVVLFQFGVNLWYALVWICYHRYDINCLALINLSYSSHHYALDGTGMVSGQMATIAPADPKDNVVLLRGIRATARKLFSAFVVSLISYWIFLVVTPSHSFMYFPIVNVLFIFILAYSFYVVFKPGTTMGQQRVHSSIKRVLLGKIDSAAMRTNDIFFSDTLTSYAKVLNDLVYYLWMTLVASGTLYNTRVEALVLAYPQLLRMKQCFHEYKKTRQKQHIFNFCKYSALLGPIFVNMLIKLKMLKLVKRTETNSEDLERLNSWWCLVSAISSLYLFVWDVHMDWGFGLLELFLGSRTIYVSLRAEKLVFRKPAYYYSVIFIDFVLRFVWVFKAFVIQETEMELGLRHRVGNFLFGYSVLLLGYVILETLELFRRWLWCFLKWENDLSKLPKEDSSIPMSDLKAG